MDKIILDKLHDEQINILDEIVRICNKHNIKYFLIYGSLLGSIRHKDFIPWDDDLDIAMPREDYEKFLKVADKELQKPYILDYIKTNKKYYLPFLKVRNKETIFNEVNSRKYNGNKGIFVDVFPLDYVKDIDTFKFRFSFKIILFLSVLLSYKSIKLYKKNIFFNILVIFSKLIPNSFIIKLINYLVSINSTSEKQKNLICFCGLEKLENSSFKTKDIFPLKKIKFHDKFYMGVNNYHNVLTSLYDNYMELPPKSKRVTHNPISIKFMGEDEIFFEGSDNK